MSNIAYNRGYKNVYQPEVYPATLTNKQLRKAVKKRKKKFMNHKPIFMIFLSILNVFEI